MLRRFTKSTQIVYDHVCAASCLTLAGPANTVTGISLITGRTAAAWTSCSLHWQNSAEKPTQSPVGSWQQSNSEASYPQAGLAPCSRVSSTRTGKSWESLGRPAWMSGLVAAVVMMSLHDRPVECAPRLAPTAKALAIGQPQPKQSPAAYSKKRKASPSASTPPFTVYSVALAPEPKRSPAAYSDRSKKSGYIYEIETESSRRIPGSNQASRPKGSVRHAVARRMALVPWRQDDQLVSPPATQRDEPGTLSRHALEETQLKEWTTRVLQAAMLDTTRLPKQLTEASQYAMRATTLRVSGAGPILAAEWIWRSLTPA